MKKLKKLGLVFVGMCMCALMTVGLVACGGNNSGESGTNTTLVVGTQNSFNKLNRLDASSGSAPGYNYDVLSGAISQMALVGLTEDGHVPQMTTYQNSADFSEWTFTIKEGLKWHDSTAENPHPVTADDIIFTASLNKKLQATCQKVSDKVVKMVCPTSNPRFLSTLSTMRIMPKSLMEAYVDDVASLPDDKSVVGCGPFKFKSFNKENGVLTFEKYQEFVDADKIKFDKVIFKTFNDETALSLALKAGDIDMIYNYSKGLSRTLEADFKDESNIVLDKFSDSSNPMNFIFNNQTVSNKNVRKAIAKAIDYKAIRERFGTSFARESYTGFVSDFNTGFKQTSKLARDLQTAKTMLANEGYTSSNKFKFTILVRSDASFGEIAKLIKASLDETGLVETILSSVDVSNYVTKIRAHEGYDATLTSLTSAGMNMQGGQGSIYFTEKDCGVPYGNISAKDTEYYGILTELKTAKSLAEYETASGKFQDYCANNMPGIALYYDSKVQAYSTSLTGFDNASFKADNTFGLLNIDAWSKISKK